MRQIKIAVAAVAAVVALSSCFGPLSETCLSGRVCPRGMRCASDQDVCVPDEGNGTCGNGRLEPGEQCDDGNVETDDNCLFPTCTVAFCGDGVVNDAGEPDGGHREQCDDMGESATCNRDCTLSVCGDSKLNTTAGEQCDFGPTDTITCNHDCTFRSCGDGYANGAAGEQCDDNTIHMTACPYGQRSCVACPNCDGYVTLHGPFCGDGQVDTVDAGFEACDDGNNVTETSCPYGPGTCTACNADCTAQLSLTGPSCGDGVVNGPSGTEICDDGNTQNETACPYGTPVCTTCNSTCSAALHLTGHYCGDGNVDAFDGGVEACDDGNNVTETACPYGTPTCSPCNATCTTMLRLTGPVCGDGNVDAAGAEACDDGNTDSCGTCSADCKKLQIGAATGKIFAVAHNLLNDGEVFILSDGTSTRVFEFDKGPLLPDGGPSIDAGAIRVFVGSNDAADTVAGHIAQQISSAGLRISAQANSNQVNLSNTDVNSGSAGNRPIIETVNAGQFIVDGMSGGGGLDCPPGTGCESDQDCLPPLTCGGDAGAVTCQ